LNSMKAGAMCSLFLFGEEASRLEPENLPLALAAVR
jgi:hypothetical protein